MILPLSSLILFISLFKSSERISNFKIVLQFRLEYSPLSVSPDSLGGSVVKFIF